MTVSKRKTLKVLMAGLLCSAAFTALTITASAETYTGTCGTNVEWKYDESTEILTFSVADGVDTAAMGDAGADAYGYYGYMKKAKTVVFEEGITYIGKEAFYNTNFDYGDPKTELTEVIMADTVTSIGDRAFGYCAKLRTVDFSDHLVSIGEGAFANCFSLGTETVDLDLPDSVTTIGANAFYFGSRIKNVKFPAKLKTIGNSAFESCSVLTAADFSGTKLETIGEEAFNMCSKLETLILPSTVKSIAGGENDIGNAFKYCIGLTTIYCYADPSAPLIWKDAQSDDFKTPAGSHKTVCYVPYVYLDTYRTAFSGVNVTFETLELDAELYGYTLSLDGDIGVNFYMALSDDLKNNADAYMEFTDPNGSKTEKQTVKVADVVNNAAKQITTTDGKIYYQFKCRVSAKDIASTITAQMKLNESENIGSSYSYSVKEYAEYLLSHANASGTAIQKQYAKASALVKSMLNYGAAAQTYFGTDGVGLANSSLSDDEQAAVASAEIPESGFAVNDLPSGATFEGATLSLRSETTLSFYFKGLDDSTEFSCTGYTVEKEVSGLYVIARIRGIKAKRIGEDFTVLFGDSTVTYSPMTYCYNVVTDTDNQYSDDLKNVCRALYLYSQKAASYFGN